MLFSNKIWLKFVNSRETKPLALTERLKNYNLVYYEDALSIDSNIVITSIEDELILAIYFTDYSPKKEKAEVSILDEQGKKKGILYIHRREIISVNDAKIYLYKIISARSYLLHFFPILMNHLVYAAKNRFKYKLREGKRLHDLFVYYIKARPVFLLSVKDGDNFDIFPVDLTGNIFNDYFIQSIKSTNQGINIIKKASAFCLSAVPFDQAGLIYKHHEQRKKEGIHLKKLLFTTSESRMLKIPAPDFAINVREFQVEKIFENGAYTSFLIKCLNEYKLSDAMQFAHTPWYCLTNGS